MDPEILEAMRAAAATMPIHQLFGFDYVDTDEDGLVVVSMPVRAEAMGASGNLHGGAIATLIDVASATCAARNSGFEPVVNTVVTADLHVRYLARPHGDMVYAWARLVRAGSQLVVVECKVVDEEDRIVASADFSSMIVPLRAPLLPDTPHDPASPEL